MFLSFASTSKLILFTLLLSFLCLRVNSQSNVPELKISKQPIVENDLIFKRFYSADGMPDDRIRSIFQDFRGFIWIGTMNGLCVYDGYNFKQYFETNKTNSIKGNWIHSIAEDQNHNIWLGTNEGLNIFNTQTETFNLVDQSLKNVVINTLLFDKYNTLWIGTANGLVSYDQQSNKAICYKDLPLVRNISKIISSYDNYIWITTSDGVLHFNVKTHQYEFYKIAVKANPYGDKFWSMFEQNKDLFLTTGGDGLLKLPFNLNTKAYGKPEHINHFSNSTETLDDTEIFDICKERNGDFWLATGRGLANIQDIDNPNRKIKIYTNNPLNNNSISYNQVFKIFIDRTNVLWCGTELGLNKLDINLIPFDYYTFNDKSATDQVRSIYTLDGENIWFGTAKKGAFSYNLLSNESKTYQFSPIYSSLNHNRSIFFDNETIWSGSLNGIVKINTRAGNSYSNSFDNNAIFSLYKDQSNQLWIGTNNGLFKSSLDGKTIKAYLLNSKNRNLMRKEFIRTLFQDAEGFIWIGSENGGLFRLDPKTDKVIAINNAPHQGQIWGDIIFSVAEYPKNTFWVGTESGLNKIVTTHNNSGYFYNISNYFESDGLPEKSVNGIIADDNGNLWISTIKGLVKFDVASQKFQTYLTDISFNYSCYYKLNKHCLLLGATDGFVKFDPSAIKSIITKPTVALSNFKLFNQTVAINQEINGETVLTKNIDKADEITLNYRNNQFSFEFTALEFSNPSANKFMYKMQGFDNGWITTNAINRTATYTNLDPGRYEFKVVASTSPGNWNDNAKTIVVNILPPPWKAWWAYIIYAALLIALFYFLIEYFITQVKQNHQIQFERKEKEQLKNLNEMKVSFFTDISHEFKTPLSLIIGPAEDILATKDLSIENNQKINLIVRNCKKLLYLVEELLTFQKMESNMLKLRYQKQNILDFVKDLYENFLPIAQKRNINFTLESDFEDVKVLFDPGKIEMALNNLLFNAFKYVPVNGEIKISLSLTTGIEITEVHPNLNKTLDKWLSVTIQDNGKGISAEEFNHLFERFFSENSGKGFGLGLSLTKRLVELHGGFIVVQSTPNVLTSFIVYLPLKNVIPDAEFPIMSSQNKTQERFDVTSILEDDTFNPQRVAFKKTNIPEKTLLIVDDNIEILNYLTLIFSKDYKIKTASNGVEAIESIAKDEPDLIISDVMMPEMDGVEFCKIIKNDVNTSHIPFILLTAKSTIEQQLIGMQNGADDYVAKPFNSTLLKLKAERLLELQQKSIEKFTLGGGVIIPKNITQNPLDEKFITKVTATINANLSNENFSVEELGSEVAMSRSNLFRKLKALTGQTPIEFIYHMRLHKGMELLLQRKMSVSEIAYEVGFKNPSSFTKSFRKHFGKSPSEYLNKVLEAYKG